MRIYVRGMVFMMLCWSLAACNRKLDATDLAANIVEGGSYYTQVVMHYEKNIYPTTNYHVGVTIPINTPVKLLEMDSKTIDIEVGAPINQKVLVKNVEKHTGDDVQQAFNKLFAKQPLNLAQFSDQEQEHIKAGTVAVGMGRKAVLAAIGYPPITRTPNLDANSWVFWRNRFDTYIVNFKDGKVSDIVN